MYQEMEVWYPFYRLARPAARCTVVAEEGRTIPASSATPARATRPRRRRPTTSTTLVIPGGVRLPDYMRRHEADARLVRAMAGQGKVVAAICHGPWVCVRRRNAAGQAATCFFAIKDDVINAGANYEDAPVVVDGSLVTSRKPDDLPAFCRACIEVLVRDAVVARLKLDRLRRGPLFAQRFARLFALAAKRSRRASTQARHRRRRAMRPTLVRYRCGCRRRAVSGSPSAWPGSRRAICCKLARRRRGSAGRGASAASLWDR